MKVIICIRPLGSRSLPYDRDQIWVTLSKHANYATVDQSSNRTVADRYSCVS